MERHGLLGGRGGGGHVARPPRQEAGQPGLHRPPPGEIGIRAIGGHPRAPGAQQGVDLPQGGHGGAGVGVGPVVDHPLRPLEEGVGDGQPPPVAGGEQVDEGGQDPHTLPVRPPLLGLAEGLLEHLEGFVVARHGGAGEVQGRFPEAPGDQQDPPDLAVEDQPAGAADPVVDRVPDDGVRHLVADPAGPLLLGHEPGAGQPLEDGRERLEGTIRVAHQLPQLDPPAGHRQQIEDGDGLAVEEPDPGPDPGRQLLGQEAQARPWHTPFLPQRPEQPDGVERDPLRAFQDPIDDVLPHGPAHHVLGQFPQRLLPERFDIEAAQRPFLLQLEQYPDGEGLVGQLTEAGGGHYQGRSPGEAQRQVVEEIPGRGVGLVHVVEDGDDRPAPGQIAEERPEALQEAGAGRLPVGSRAPHGGDAAEQAGQVVERTAAQLGDLRRGQLPEVGVEGLGPQAEGGHAPERPGPGGEDGGPAGVAGHDVVGQAGLADPGVARQQDTAQLAGGGAPPFRLQVGDLGCPPDELGALDHPPPVETRIQTPSRGPANAHLRAVPLRLRQRGSIGWESRRRPVPRRRCGRRFRRWDRGPSRR